MPDASARCTSGLHAPNKQGGVIITSVPSVHYADAADTEKQLDYLASRLYGGGGSHGVFSKTVGAGLAYSNGLRGSVSAGRVGYYAERTPELPQTVRFVVGVIKDGKLDRTLGEYVLAQAFGESRASQTYEARAEGIANDLADGQPPEQVRRFRQSILDLRKRPAARRQALRAQGPRPRAPAAGLRPERRRCRRRQLHGDRARQAARRLGAVPEGERGARDEALPALRPGLLDALINGVRLQLR